MNLIMLETESEAQVLSTNDVRVAHVKQVLKMGVGDSFYVGLINGPKGMAKIEAQDAEGLRLSVCWAKEIERALPIKLILGLPRPQTARKILQECTSLGVDEICFFKPETGEGGYAQSKLWHTDEWQKLLIRGAEQAFTTTVPEIRHYEDLVTCLDGEASSGWQALALDNYEASAAMNEGLEEAKGHILAIGAERGWSDTERDLLRKKEFKLVHLGERVLRMETACIAGVSLVSSRMNYYQRNTSGEIF